MNNVIKIFKNNDVFQKIEVLKNNRNKRYKANKFLVEGVKMLNLAIENNYSICSFIYSDENKLSDWAKGLIRDINTTVNYQTTPALMKQLSEKEQTSEILAIIEQRQYRLEDIKLSKAPLIVVADRPIYPGNLGSIIRSADAFGADAVITTGHSADFYDPQCVRGSIGTIFSIPYIALDSPTAIIEYINSDKNKHLDFQIIGSTANTDKLITQVDYTKPTIMLVGNETNGLSNAWKDLANEMVKIPISGSASSLNVSSALSILLYEVGRQRGMGW